MKICITGAASYVAREVIKTLKPEHELTLIDIQYPADFPFKKEVRILTGSVLDRQFIKDSFQNQDVVIHMAIVQTDAPREEQ